MDVVQVTGSLDGRVAETADGLVRLVVTPLHDEPTRRLGAEVDLGHDDQRGHTGLENHPQYEYFA